MYSNNNKKFTTMIVYPCVFTQLGQNFAKFHLDKETQSLIEFLTPIIFSSFSLMWGILADNFSIKFLLTINSFLGVIISATIGFTNEISWLYILSSLLSINMLSAYFSLIPLLVCRIYEITYK